MTVRIIDPLKEEKCRSKTTTCERGRKDDNYLNSILWSKRVLNALEKSNLAKQLSNFVELFGVYGAGFRYEMSALVLESEGMKVEWVTHKVDNIFLVHPQKWDQWW